MRGKVNRRHPEAKVAAQDRTLWRIFISQAAVQMQVQLGITKNKVIAMSLGSNSLHLL